MRMRKKKWAEPFLVENANIVIEQPNLYKGKWKESTQCTRLCIEIGCGKGDYIIQMAKMNSNTLWIGIERDRNVAAVATKKIVESDLTNIRVIAQDADQFESWFMEHEIDNLHLNFSDPWPKTGYKKRRLTHRNFLARYEHALSDEGSIIMKTDNATLFEFSLVELNHCEFSLDEVSVDFRRTEHPEDAITEYESKFMSEGKPIYRAVWTKK